MQFQMTIFSYPRMKQLGVLLVSTFLVIFTITRAESSSSEIEQPRVVQATDILDDPVWDTSRGDLIVWVEEHLERMNISKGQIAAFTRNPAIPLSLQLAIVENLEALPNVPQRADVIALMSAALAEYQARFLASSLRMIVDYNEKQAPVVNIAAIGSLVFSDRDEKLILPAPGDYVSWTARVASIVTDPQLLAYPHRVLLTSAKLSQLASKQFASNGWQIYNTLAH